jgi:acyl carrier protein
MNSDATAGSIADRTAEQQLRDAVRTVVGNIAPEHSGPAEPEQRLVLDLGYDSLRLVELAFVFEELFGLDPEAMDDAPAFDRVVDIEAYLWDRVRGGRARVPSGEALAASLEAF